MRYLWLLLLLLLPIPGHAAGIILTWDALPDTYLVQRYSLYRSVDASAYTPLACTEGTGLLARLCTDPVQATGTNCYQVTATVAGVESPRSTPLCTRPGGYVSCAIEGATCTFIGTQEVVYGAGTTWVTKMLTGGTACSNTVFGDPLPNTQKSCFVRPLAPLQPLLAPRNLRVR